ncbi:MAG: Malate-2H(+)/Na(+)-lactate antiporter [Flavobacteriia bacterium]|nr:MAG: Malate-2H(+)/Na(+)-lactate antiporter [Flavobacteriia bacterium]
MTKKPSFFLALFPVLFLIVALSVNVVGVYGDDALSGSNQVILLLSGLLAMIVGRQMGVEWDTLFQAVGKSIANSATAMVILLLIGGLAASWLLGGVVPAMIHYGLELLDPTFFLPASLIICAAVSLATGSSWSTTATMGIALIGIGKAMGISEAMTAGAVISGAYFGDKLSPLSDTTNLAPAMAGTDLFTHIRYMAWTTVPSISIALIAFVFIGLGSAENAEVQQAVYIQEVLEMHFHMTPWLFAAPAVVVLLIALRVPAIPSIFSGIAAGLICALLFQSELLSILRSTDDAEGLYRLLMDTVAQGLSVSTESEMVNELLNTSGMKGMLGTIWLILSAMVFGGAMEGAGLLRVISERLLRLARTDFSLIGTTSATSIGLNLTASDQYLAIVVPGRMYAQAYEERGLAPENLSRTLEDAGTVTSVLVPWNTCGAYQSSVLGVATGAYLPYAIFNWLSPLMTLVFSFLAVRIKRITRSADSEVEA